MLTPQEATALFNVMPWADCRARVANLLAATTGLRAGEVLALRLCDVGVDRMSVRHRWSEVDGLKCTKTGAERTVPLLPAVRDEIITVAAGNPHGGTGDGFIFYGLRPDRPMAQNVLREGPGRALVALSLRGAKTENRTAAQKQALADWRRRGVCFHSWRRFCAARMADHVDARTVILATGHKTAAMFEHYAKHALEEQLQKVGAAAEEVFAKAVPFETGAAS